MIKICLTLYLRIRKFTYDCQAGWSVYINFCSSHFDLKAEILVSASSLLIMQRKIKMKEIWHISNISVRGISLLSEPSCSSYNHALKVTKHCFFLKVYLRYKMITCQNMSSDALVTNFIILQKGMFRSQDIQFFVFLIISWFTKAVHEAECIFEYIF